MLLQVTPGRTLESIKEMHKSQKYRKLLDSLQQESDSSEPPELEHVRPVSDAGEPEDIPLSNEGLPAETNNGWAEALRITIQELGVPDGMDLDGITPGQPTAVTRSVLDTEYARWLPPIAKPSRNPPRRPARPANINPRRGVELQSVAKVLARSIFFLPGCIGDRLPLPTPNTMLSFIHLTLWLYCNIVWGERGVRKIKYKVLKSKSSVMERYSIQRAKYFCH